MFLSAWYATHNICLFNKAFYSSDHNYLKLSQLFSHLIDKIGISVRSVMS